MPFKSNYMSFNIIIIYCPLFKNKSKEKQEAT